MTSGTVPEAERPAAARVRAVYLLTCRPGEDPAERARALAWEQTVELPPGSVPPAIEERAVGRVESLRRAGERRWRAVVSHAVEAWRPDLAQLANLLWGNVSMQGGVLLEELQLPPGAAEAAGGPAFGVSGVREACEVPERALLCGALKPLGASAAELARRAGRLALGGADLVKDDHSLSDQPWARFGDRVRRCADAVAEANERTGRSCLYVPSVTGRRSALADRIGRARDAGCRGVLLNAVPAGLAVLQGLGEEEDVFVLAHPALAGGFFGADHGIAPEVLLGELFRLGGADGVIYPNAGGRFPFDEETCRAINRRLREERPGLRRSFPVPGGGIDVERIPRWVEAYGPDTVFLVGGSLYARPDLTEATRRLVDELERHAGRHGDGGGA